MRTFRKKPVEISAFRYGYDEYPQWFIDAIKKDSSRIISGVKCIIIDTLEGDMKASPGDYIIQGIKGEIYPCKADIFELSYDEVKKS